MSGRNTQPPNNDDRSRGGIMRVIATTIAVLLLAGCGVKQENQPGPGAPSAAPTPTGTSATTTPKRSMPVLTREQAGQRYLALGKPINDVFDEPKCKAAEGFLVDGGSWPPDGHSEYGEHADRVLRDCHKRLVPLYEKTIKAFQTTLWPVDARADVADLISQDQAFLYCLKKTSKAAGMDAMYKALECFAEDDGSADRVRARFGLPIRTPS